jgi:putative sigma-54 modulation protein
MVGVLQLTLMLTENWWVLFQRMDKLEKYYDKVVSADIYLKLEKTSKENKIVDGSVPGDDFMVKKQCKTFES